MKKILVLGISGFSGRHFINFINKKKLFKDYEFYGIDFNYLENKVSNLQFYQGDCTDKAYLKNIIIEISPHYIINFIGKITGSDINDFNRINVEIPYTILETANKYEIIEKILLVGSAAEYGIPVKNPIYENDKLCPVNLYGLSKVYQTQLAEYYFRVKDVPVVIGRTFNIKGEGLSTDLAIGNFIKQINEIPDGGEIKVGNLSTYRDYMDVEEVIDHYWNILLKGSAGEIYNICSGKPRKMSDLLNELIEKSGKKINVTVQKDLIKKNDVEIIFGSNEKYKQLMSC